MSSIWNRILLCGVIILMVFGSILYLIGVENLQVQPYQEAYLKGDLNGVTNPLSDEVRIIQSYENHADEIKGLTLRFTTYEEQFRGGEIAVTLRNSSGKTLGKATLNGDEVRDNEDVYFDFGKKIPVNKGESISFLIESTVRNKDMTPSLWMIDKVDHTKLLWGDEELDHTLYMIPDACRDAQFTFRYIVFLGSIVGCFLLFCLRGRRNDKKELINPSNEIIHIFDRYTFLLRQLVGRDFAIKYRRSYLGIVWVVLNPLLTMIVMSAVFSYIFRFTIDNYAVYLILGNITFSCFSEITQLCTQSIVGNGQLIKKVYIPKYIFPLSKALFAFVNFMLTLIPAIAVILYYRIPFTENYLLLPVALVGLFMFALGIGFFLSALQVFMRDTQYLYTIVLTLWTYVTPIFYSEESLSPLLMRFMMFNPMYIYISMIRKIMLYGTTPSIYQMMACLWLGIMSLTIGVSYFFRKQNKFILHI